MNNDGEICEEKIPMETPSANICKTRSCAALRAADLDWIVGPEYSLGGYIFGDSQLTFMTQHEKVIIFRHLRGVTTDLLDV